MESMDEKALRRYSNQALNDISTRSGHKSKCNYDLLLYLPRKLQMELTKSSLERSRGMKWNGILKVMTHGLEILIEATFTQPAMEYLYAKWDRI